ncbi:MAG TPA: hypothetical protein PLP42_06345 [Acidobacteriota bacterium]|nr:hypothetical protein [Acidobacteriota bacterium]
MTRREPFPILAVLRKARLDRLRRRLAFRRTLLERIGAGIRDLEEVLNSLEGGGEGIPGEEGSGEGFDMTGDFSDTGTDMPASSPAPRRSSAPSSSPKTSSNFDKVLFQIFADMEGEGSEFTADRRPKVAEVNDRLESLGHDPTNRAEIDRAFDVYLSSKRPEKGKKLTPREKTLFRIFDQMQGEKSEFTADGRPQVGAVNDRLESLGQEASSREEIDKAYKKYLGI